VGVRSGAGEGAPPEPWPDDVRQALQPAVP